MKVSRRGRSFTISFKSGNEPGAERDQLFARGLIGSMAGREITPEQEAALEDGLRRHETSILGGPGIVSAITEDLDPPDPNKKPRKRKVKKES